MGAIGGAVVDENDFVGEIARERGPEGGEAGLRESEAVVEGDDEADLHAATESIGGGAEGRTLKKRGEGEDELCNVMYYKLGRAR